MPQCSSPGPSSSASSGPLPHLAETAAATSRYLQALTTLAEREMRAPSLLPGWTRGHVVTHLARNADGLRNLLVWARTGVETPQYPSWEQRNRDIDSGAGRPVTELIVDASESAARFAEEAARLTPEQWQVPVRTLSSRHSFPARNVLRSRRTEVEVHHADLGIGYGAADWPTDFARMLVERACEDRADGPALRLFATDTGDRWTVGAGTGPEVTGALADLVWWLIGRGGADRLVSSTGQLPALTAWR